jgi:small subunit ribosomal protein S2
MVDTNSDPSNIDFIIPANDDATKSIEIVMSTVCAAISEGLEERKIDKADADAAAAVSEDEEGAENAPRRERRSKTARRERIQKEDEEALKARVASKFMKDDEE